MLDSTTELYVGYDIGYNIGCYIWTYLVFFFLVPYLNFMVLTILIQVLFLCFTDDDYMKK
jgi:hypothetical protein